MVKVRVEPKPVLTAGEFVWGTVLVTESYPEGLPCSTLVARLVLAIDGRRSLGGVIDELGQEVPAERKNQLEESVLTAARILYVDGTIARLERS